MMDQWSTLSARERFLVAICAVLVTVFALYFLVISPAVSFNDRAQGNLVRAESTSALVARAISLKGQSGAHGGTVSDLRGVITNSAQAYGLRWINIRSNEGDVSVTISFADAAPSDLLGWLLELRQDQEIVAISVRMSEASTGNGVDASITMARR